MFSRPSTRFGQPGGANRRIHGRPPLSELRVRPLDQRPDAFLERRVHQRKGLLRGCAARAEDESNGREERGGRATGGAQRHASSEAV